MTEERRERFVPFSVRETGASAAWDVLHEGVPEHLLLALRGVVLRGMSASTAMDQSLHGVVARRLRLSLAAVQGKDVAARIISWANADKSRYLDLADCVLYERGERLRALREQGLLNWGPDEDAGTRYVRELHQVLEESDSAYAVAWSDEAPLRLVRRVDATATAAVQDTARQGKDASKLLAAAWAATFQREPDLSAAYRDVVLAVEAAACPVLIPNDATPTLGRANAHLKQTVGRWTVAGLDDKSQPSASTLLAMLETIWQNQGRHAVQGGTAPAPVEQAEAEAVLFLAVTLVQWLDRGLVQLR